MLCLEPFARTIQNDDLIKGIPTPDNALHVKMSLYADDNTSILTSDQSIVRFFYHVANFERISGSKINYKKSNGVFLGKWKDRSDHPFGISWIHYSKVLGYLFGNGYNDDDVFNKIFLKFSNVLNLSKCRDLSLKGKSSILNIFAYSKIIYYVMARVPPDYYINMFQRKCFLFMWRTRYEQIARKTLYLPFSIGGLMVPNIKLKCNSFYLLHISKLINNYPAPWTHFAKYWIGLSLREYNESFASNFLPHSEYVPPFYSYCLELFRSFIKSNPDVSFSSWSAKEFYLCLLDSSYRPKCYSNFPLVDFKNSFSNINSNAVDSTCRDVCFKLTHDNLLTNNLLYSKNMSKTRKCLFCNNVETSEHLFLQCYFTKPLNRTVLYLLRLVLDSDACLSLKWFKFFDIKVSSSVQKYVTLVFLSESRYIIWLYRNKVKINKSLVSTHDLIAHFLNRIKFRIRLDYNRLDVLEFNSYWEEFCKVDNDNLVYFSVLNMNNYVI